RLKFARELGADMTINIEEVQDPDERISLVKAESTGEYGVDAVFECTGVPSTVPEGIKMLRRGGTYAVVGHFTDAGATTLNPFSDLNNKHITLVGVWGGDVAHFVRGRPIIESGKYPFERFVSHKLPLERCSDAMKTIMGDYRLDGREVNKLDIVGNP
ncbi:MAG: zinc-binding dehydrogenase, partial [Candidatus Thorarchaeota archaeon]